MVVILIIMAMGLIPTGFEWMFLSDIKSVEMQL